MKKATTGNSSTPSVWIQGKNPHQLYSFLFDTEISWSLTVIHFHIKPVSMTYFFTVLVSTETVLKLFLSVRNPCLSHEISITFSCELQVRAFGNMSIGFPWKCCTVYGVVNSKGGGGRGLKPPFVLDNECIWMGAYGLKPLPLPRLEAPLF